MTTIPSEERLRAEMALLDIGIALDEPVYAALPIYVIHPRTQWFRFMAFGAMPIDGCDTLEYSQAVDLLMEIEKRQRAEPSPMFTLEKSKTMLGFQASWLMAASDAALEPHSWVGQATMVGGDVYHNLVMIEQPTVTPAMVQQDIVSTDWSHSENDPVLIGIATTLNGSTYVGEAICGNIHKQDVEAGKRSAMAKITGQIFSAMFYQKRSKMLQDACAKLDNVNLLLSRPLLEVGVES